jgi:hypothetical protein
MILISGLVGATLVASLTGPARAVTYPTTSSIEKKPWNVVLAGSTACWLSKSFGSNYRLATILY